MQVLGQGRHGPGQGVSSRTWSRTGGQVQDMVQDRVSGLGHGPGQGVRVMVPTYRVMGSC